MTRNCRCVGDNRRKGASAAGCRCMCGAPPPRGLSQHPDRQLRGRRGLLKSDDEAQTAPREEVPSFRGAQRRPGGRLLINGRVRFWGQSGLVVLTLRISAFDGEFNRSTQHSIPFYLLALNPKVLRTPPLIRKLPVCQSQPSIEKTSTFVLIP